MDYEESINNYGPGLNDASTLENFLFYSHGENYALNINSAFFCHAGVSIQDSSIKAKQVPDH